MSCCGHALSRDWAVFGIAKDRIPVELSQAEHDRSGRGEMPNGFEPNI